MSRQKMLSWGTILFARAGKTVVTFPMQWVNFRIIKDITFPKAVLYVVNLMFCVISDRSGLGYYPREVKGVNTKTDK